MESWRTVWRDGVAPLLSTQALESLHKALVTDDARLLQGATTSPPPLVCVRDWEPEGACLLGYAGWQGEGLATVEQVEQFFANACHQCDLAVKEHAGCRWLLNWFDETPRAEMRRQLIPEVARALALREVSAAGSGPAGVPAGEGGVAVAPAGV